MTNDLVRRRTTHVVDLTLTSLPAVQRACYALGDRFDVLLDRKSDNFVELTIFRQDEGSDLPSEAEVQRLLLDFALRVDIEERTRAVRNAIVNAALRHAK